MYNEAGRIERSLTVLRSSGLLDDGTELVLVDDGSDDGTPEVVERLLRELPVPGARLLRLPENRGKGAAVRAGMLAGHGAARVFVDADLCVGADDIERCFQALEQGADVAYGTRAHAGSAMDRSQPGLRVLSGRVFNALLRALGLTRELDTQCGLKGFSTLGTEVAIEPLRTERFAFDVEALARAERGGLVVEGVPVRWSHVDASRVRPVQDGIDMALAAIRIRRLLGRPAAQAPAGAMATDAIEAMASVESSHWWFRAKHRLVLDELGAAGVSGLVVDVGAGTGGLLARLGETHHRAVGFELDEAAVALARTRTPPPALGRCVAERLPVRSASAAAVTALDVVEHLDDDVLALRELARVVEPGGLLVLAVPAYQWAWSDHDVRLGHRRRYTRAQIREAAEAAGLTVQRCTHFHSWLAPVALAVRRTPLGRLQRGSAEEASMGGPTVNRVLRRVTDVERWLLRRTDLPVGLSILLVARVEP